MYLSKNKTITLLLSFLVSLHLTANEISIKTENYPPYSMQIDGKIEGLSVNVLEAMFKQMKANLDKSDITLTSWSDAYSSTLKNKDTMVFSTTKTNSRKDLFKWVGPISNVKIGLITLKDNDITINQEKDLNNYTIGSVKKDIGENLLLEKNFNKKNLDSIDGTNSLATLFYKLERRKIDMIAYDTRVALYSAELNGYDKDEYKIVYTLGNKDLYFAFNKHTPDKIIEKWQKALDEIKENGQYKKIIEKY